MAASSCHVLLVEDDRTIAANLIEFLESIGHHVDVAHHGAAAIARLESETFDVIVLDLGLPRTDGLEVLRHLRSVLGLSTPVLVLTARDQLVSKLDCFEAGADDYLTKPFAMAEVAMRLVALHRRAVGAVGHEVMRCGPLVLDRRRHEVRVGANPVRLMPRSFLLLEALLRDPGRVVPRSELERVLWSADPPEGDALRSQVHLLRRALAQAGFDGLETVHGIGYRVQCPTSTGG
jgi:DNA-binding response OmpR family regulator